LTEARTSLKNVLKEKTDEFHKDIITTSAYTKLEQDKFVDENTGMDSKERNIKLSDEYEMLGFNELAEKK